MAQLRPIYEETINDLRARGFSGYVDMLPDYKQAEPIPRQNTAAIVSPTMCKTEKPHAGNVGPSPLVVDI